MFTKRLTKKDHLWLRLWVETQMWNCVLRYIDSRLTYKIPAAIAGA